MGILSRIRGMFSRAPQPVAPAAAGGPAHLTMRRWEAADTDRLNQGHWQGVTGQNINADLLPRLETLRSRAAYEVASNPTLEGVLNTYGDDVAGTDGPKLQVNSGDDEFDKAAEAVWKMWFEEPDVGRRLGGVDILKLWCRGLWINGEFLAQRVTSRNEDAPVRLRLRVLHPRRLDTPPEFSGAVDVIMGVKVDASTTEPLQYYLSQPVKMGAYEISVGRFRSLPASAVIHRFVSIEEDQVRGVPWLATPLDTIADLRDYDAQVMDAARNAADWAVSLYTEHPDATFLDVNEETTIQRRTMGTLPPGWKAQALNPPQPSTTYKDFRSERQGDIGRPRGMPRMMVRLDSSDHNYSSARFDSQIYRRGVEAMQGWLQRRTLVPLFYEVLAEALLYAAGHPQWEHAQALLRRPASISVSMIWPKMPHVDPSKESAAERTRLENGTLTYADALAAHGLDEDEVIASRAKSNRKLAEAGLPPLPAASSSGPELAAQIAMDEAQQSGDPQAMEDAQQAAKDAPGLAKPTAKSAVATGPVGLNGAQITAAVEVIGKLREGSMVPAAAIELLAAAGIDRAAAEKMVAATPVREQIVDKEYKQEVVRDFIKDGTVSDVIANATLIKDLVEQSGLPVNPEYKEPWLPVQDDQGNAVTGEVVKDSQGDIVGGESAPSAPPSPEPIKKPDAIADSGTSATDGQSAQEGEGKQQQKQDKGRKAPKKP